MNVTTMLARRVMIPRRLNFINIIAIVSVLGIVIGTAALIIVMSLFNGFRAVARSMMVGFGPHVQVSAPVAQAAGAGEQYVDVSMSKLAIQFNGHTSVVQAYGVDSKDIWKMKALENATVIGVCMLTPLDYMPSLVIAPGVANELQIALGDTVRVLSPAMIEDAVVSLVKPSGYMAVVRGVFQSNTAGDVDYSRVYTDAAFVRKLSRGKERRETQIFMANPQLADKVAQRIREASPGVTVQTWEDLNRGIVDTMKLERVGTFIVLSLIVVVAAFNIVVSLSLSVMERRRDFAVLKTIGMTEADIRRVVLYQGIMLGVLSVSIGVAIGVLAVLGQIEFGWIRFDTSAGFLVPTLPMELHGMDVAVTALVGLVLASCAALPPANRASRLVVAEAVRMD